MTHTTRLRRHGFAPRRGVVFPGICLYAALLTALLPAVRGDAPAAATGGVPTAPVLRLESGNHSGPITAASEDAAGRYLATASVDRTARVWEVATGKLLATLRPPIGPGDEGELLSVAVSPDGAAVACAGHTGFLGDYTCVYVFDRATAKMTLRIDGTQGPVSALAYSRDGRYLAVGTDRAVFVLRASDGTRLGTDDDCQGAVSGLSFAPSDGPGVPLRLAAAAGDGFVRLYKFMGTAKVPLRLVASTDPGSDKNPDISVMAGRARPSVMAGRGRPVRGACAGPTAHPGAVAFSPDGALVAVGDVRRPQLTLLSGGSLRAVAVLGLDAPVDYNPADDTARVRYGLDAACWSPDGAVVYGGGLTSDDDALNAVYGWRLPAKAEQDSEDAWPDPARLPTPTARVVALFPNKEAGLLYSACDAAFGLVGTGSRAGSGHPSLFHALPAYFRGVGELLASDDGTKLEVQAAPADADAGDQPAKKSTPLLKFDVSAQHPAPGSPRAVKPPVTDRPGLLIEDWDANTTPRFNRLPVPLDPGGTCLCRAIAPDEQSFVLGMDDSLQCFDQDLRQLWSRPTPDGVLRVDVCGSGKVLVAALGDGTVRWYHARDGAEIGALFVDPATAHWVLWTPAGDYDCSPGGEALFGWHVNRGRDMAADFLPGDHFHAARCKPGLMTGLLERAAK